MNSTTRTERFEDRVRFNWGFWDGLSDGRRNQEPMWAGKPHFDKVYERGYGFGRATAQDDGQPESSEPAWKAHRAEEKAGRDQRRALRQARPEPTRRF